MKTYMKIERFKKGKTDEVYHRFNTQGRLLPEGVQYINSWVTLDKSVCYQIMQRPKREYIDEWINKWSDLTDFEVIPVISSIQARDEILNSH